MAKPPPKPPTRRRAKDDSTLVGRDSKSGQFIAVREATRRPATTTVERIPKPGSGGTKKR
ncbi:MAG: hypothetical protein EXR12_06095 [Rhodospirillaceae bacterium]|nr:hypothetical protein [Rhodospirillaceae bacterium]